MKGTFRDGWHSFLLTPAVRWHLERSVEGFGEVVMVSRGSEQTDFVQVCPQHPASESFEQRSPPSGSLTSCLGCGLGQFWVPET